MADKMDLSLDDIIKISKKSKSGRGRGRGGRKGGNRGAGGGVAQARNKRGGGRGGRGRGGRQGSFNRSTNVPTDKWDHDMYNPGKQGQKRGGGVSDGVGRGSGKLLVNNLDFGVSDSDINELFSEFGALRRAAVHYDRSGRSLGSADVHFERRTDAARALQQYNGVPLDGRVMHIRFVDGQTATSNSDMNGRLGQPNSRGSYGGRGGRGKGSRGRGRGRGGRQGRKEEVSAEELDKQLDDYISKMEE
ncbi:THO complex subunit 4-like [Clavelina lepadiformis]|uniref:RRM domain-containing protein n=1 Tax=Clavelina lepadiformis TaxID=159417 RepID=A0ABP0GT29_CLALP